MKVKFKENKEDSKYKAEDNIKNNNKDGSESNNRAKRNVLYKMIHSSKNLRTFSRKKLDNFISLDTLVYEILNPGENRNKNLDKIVSEIKNAEKMAEIEKEKPEKKIVSINKVITKHKASKSNKELLHITELKEEKNEKIYHNNIDNNDDISQNKILNLQMNKPTKIEYEKNNRYNYMDVVQKLKIPPEKRTIRDILKIKEYMDRSKLGINFKEEFSDINIAEKLIFFCSMEMKYQKFKKNEAITKVGDPPDSFFFIINGKVKIIKPVPKIELLTGFQYFKYLMNLKKQKENYIFMQCLRKNKTTYHIESNEGDIIKYIYLFYYLEHLKTNIRPTINFDKVLDLLDIKPEELGLYQEYINDGFYINDRRNKILKKIPIISPDLIKQYYFIFDDMLKNEVTIYEYKNILSLKTYDYFGDSSTETNIPRISTIIAEEETDLAYLSNELYFSQIASEKAILLQIKIKKLHQNYFFNSIKFDKFSTKYFTLFINERYSKGDILFTEGEKIRFLYFIQEGSIEISINKNMNEIDSLINLMKEKKDILTKNNYTEYNFNFLKEIEPNNDNSLNLLKKKESLEYEYKQINSTYNEINNFLQQKQNNKIIILNTSEDIGIVSYFLGNEFLGTCEIVSKIAKIYKIEKKYLEQILEEEINIKNKFYQRLKSKLKLYCERLFQINNIKLVMADEKITQKNLDQNKMEQNDITQSNSTINKISINYDKINSFLNGQNYCNIFNNLDNNNSSKKEKIEINLPKINNNRNKNKLIFSFDTINNINDEKKGNDYKSIRVNKILKKHIKFNNMKLFNVLNKKDKVSSSKKLFEKNIFSKKNKNNITLSPRKPSLSKDKIQLGKNSNAINDTPIRKKNNLYVTDLNADNSQNINDSNEKAPKRIDLKLNIQSSFLPNIVENFLENTKSLYCENSRNQLNNKSQKSLSIGNNRYNTENTIIIYNDKRSDILKENECIEKKRYNHPYYDPLSLIKKEQYRIFDHLNIRNESKKDFLNLHIERINELKKIRAYLKDNFKIRLKMNNINVNHNN